MENFNFLTLVKHLEEERQRNEALAMKIKAQREAHRQLAKRLEEERMKNEGLTRRCEMLLSMLRTATWSWIFNERMHQHFKRETERLRAREKILNAHLASERKRGTARTILERLFGYFIPTPARA